MWFFIIGLIFAVILLNYLHNNTVKTYDKNFKESARERSELRQQLEETQYQLDELEKNIKKAKKL